MVTCLILMVRLYMSCTTSGLSTFSDLKMTWLNLSRDVSVVSVAPDWSPQLLGEVLLHPLHVVPQLAAHRHPQLRQGQCVL